MTLVRPQLVASILIFLAGAAYGQGYGDKTMAGSAKGEMTSPMEAMEHKINDAFKNQDAKTFLSLVDQNGWSVDAMGFTPVTVLAGSLKDFVVKSYSIEGYKVMLIDKNTCLATYTWKGEGSYKGEAFPPVPSYCSTVWTKRGKEWKAIFHQESMAMGGMPQQAAKSQ
jgi:hypothetical protein